MKVRANLPDLKARVVAAGLTTFAITFVALAHANPGSVKIGSSYAAEISARLVPVAGAGTDAKTGLPKRVRHRPSGIVLVLVPAGEFQMGSPADDPDRGNFERQHRRVVRRPFYIGETEVTLDQFRRFVRETNYVTDAERGTEEGGHTRGAFAATPDGDREWNAAASWRNPFPHLKDYRPDDAHPVVHVSWNDAQRFVEHHGLRLPTEAEWEYAARAGTRTRFFWGDTADGGEGYGNLQDATGRRRFGRWNTSFAFADGFALLAPVGRFRANPWGLHDVAGNVSEWCEDVFRKEYPADGADEGAAAGEPAAPRVIRGSSWLDGPTYSRPAKRIGFLPQGRRDFIGFRVAAAAASIK